MLRSCKQFAAWSLVAIATLGLAVPTLLANPCSCARTAVESKKSLPPCCAKRLAAQGCESSTSKTDDCCSGNGPCKCPGCKCAIQAPDATTAPAVVQIPAPATHFLPLAVLAEVSANPAEQSSLTAHAEQSLLRSASVPLRALYCVWII